MKTFQLGRFTLTMIDPVADRVRLGTRYCHGGYLWQLQDEKGRKLLSGPEFPKPDPTRFNGQGLPEVLRFDDKMSGEWINVDGNDEGILLGVGTVVGRNEKEPKIGEYCTWQIHDRGDALLYETRVSNNGWGAILEREWTVFGDTLTSRTRVQNTGDKEIKAHWYPHPFFPQPSGAMNFMVQGASVPDNPGYVQLEPSVFQMNASFDWTHPGHFQWFDGYPAKGVDVALEHPVCGSIRMFGDFKVDFHPVWANENTISFEPYSLYTIEPGNEAEWALSFTFPQS